MHRSIAVAALVALGVAGAASAQTWTEPKSGAAFAVKKDDMTLLGGGLRVKKMVFTFKAYAIGFYVSDAALAGPLAAYKTASPELFKQLQTGDFHEGGRPPVHAQPEPEPHPGGHARVPGGGRAEGAGPVHLVLPRAQGGPGVRAALGSRGDARDRHGRPGQAADRRPRVHGAPVRPVRGAHADPGGHQGRDGGAPRRDLGCGPGHGPRGDRQGQVGPAERLHDHRRQRQGARVRRRRDHADRRAGSQPQDGPARGGREAADDRHVHRRAADGLRELRGRSPGS